MEEHPKIDLRKHTSPKVSRRYMYRIVFYVVFLVVLGLIIYKLSSRDVPKKEVEEVQEIRDFEIE